MLTFMKWFCYMGKYANEYTVVSSISEKAVIRSDYVGATTAECIEAFQDQYLCLYR